MLRQLPIASLLVMLVSSQAFALPPPEVMEAISRQQKIQERVAAANSVAPPAPVVAAKAAPTPPPVNVAAKSVPPAPNMMLAANSAVPAPQPSAAANSALIPEPEDEPAKPANPTKIVLDNKDWEGAKPEDVQAVLDSTLSAITPYMNIHPLGNILVRHTQKANPDSLYEKGPHGEYIIELSSGGNHWAQYVYQFSHEMCHLISNYDLAPNNSSRQQWVDESLCDAFGLFTLQQMEAQWETKPPYPNWKDYAHNFSQYADDELKQPYRKLPDGMKFGAWFANHQQQLSDDPYAEQRHLSEVVSTQLLPIFAAKPESWTALNFLNLGDDSRDKSLLMFLADWQTNTPPEIQETLGQVQQLLMPGR